VDPAGDVFSGEPVHLYFDNCRAVGEVLERGTLERRRIPVQPLGAVEPGGREGGPLDIRRVEHSLPGERVGGTQSRHVPTGKTYVVGIDAEHRRGHGGESGEDLLARVLHRTTVEVGAGRGRGGGRVRHLIGAGGGEAHPLQWQAEGGRGDLEHLRVQALTHLGAA